MKLCGKVFLLFAGFVTWFAVPLLVYSIREASSSCAGDDARLAGVALHGSSGFLDVVNVATNGINIALHDSHAGYYILAAASMICVLASHLYIAHTAVVSRQALRLHWNIFCALFGVEAAISMLLWLPPPEGYLQPGDRFLYLALGVAPSCTEQLFSARLAWHLAVCFDRFLHRSDRGHARIEAMLCVLIPLFTALVGHTMYGLGVTLTLLAAVVCSLRLRREFEMLQTATRRSAKSQTNGAFDAHAAASAAGDDVVFDFTANGDDDDADQLLDDAEQEDETETARTAAQGGPHARTSAVAKYAPILRIATDGLPDQTATTAAVPVATAQADAAAPPTLPPRADGDNAV